jgi:UMF1 family MFS transporter
MSDGVIDEAMVPGGPKGSRLGNFSWALFDWAQQPFHTVITTFIFSAYFTKAVAENEIQGTSDWGWTVGAAAFLVALAGPMLGSVADHTGNRKPWVATFSLLCIAASFCLWWVEPDAGFVPLALVLIGIGTFAVEMSSIFYNAMLPPLTPPERMGRLSGWAWGLGYFGGILLLAICLFAFVQAEPPMFGLNPDTAENIRIVGPFTAVWFLLFMLPMLLFTYDEPRKPVSLGQAGGLGVKQIATTLKNLRDYRNVARFLIGRMLYTDGINTVFAFGGIYAAGTFGFEFADIIIFGIALNVASGIGAFAFAWVDDWIGSKNTVLIALAGIIVAGVLVIGANSVTMFWVGGMIFAVFVGPAQAASRTLMGKVAPADKRNEFFGLYAFSGKATAWIGPPLLGTVTALTDSQRWGMATTIPFVVIGLLILWNLKEPETDTGAAPGPA